MRLYRFVVLFFIVPHSVLATTVNELVDMAAARYSVDAALVHAVIKTESAYNSHAVSRAGAVGLMQLMPATAARYGVSDRYDPEQNIDGGVHYLKDLLAMFNNVSLAVAGYNAGEGAVMKYNNSIPPYAETRNYVQRVLSFFNRSSNALPLPAMAKLEKPKPVGRKFKNSAAYEALAAFYGSGSVTVTDKAGDLPQEVKPKPVGRKFKNSAAYEALAAFYGAGALPD